MHKGEIVLEKSLDDIKGNIHKIQLAFEGEFPEEIEKQVDILHKESTGRVHMVIVKGDCDDVQTDKIQSRQYGTYQNCHTDFLPHDS